MLKTGVIEKAISYFRSLPKNWDNHNSPELSYQAINTFETFAKRYFKFFYLRNVLAAVPGGGIQIDFQYANKTLSLEIYSNGDIGFEKFQNNLVPEHSILSINNMDDDIVNELLQWLISN